MMDFAALQGVTIPEGVVTQITDANGMVLWMLSAFGGNVILEVEKFTSDTYAAETTYTGESFVLLDIYPKTNGTVTVSYGDLKKTITDTSGAAEPNAQQVFFGTFNNVSDSVETPASGTLTIEGDYRGFGVGSFNYAKAGSKLCECVTAIRDFGVVEIVPDEAFGSMINGACTKLTKVKINHGTISIGASAFQRCTGLTSVTIPASVTSIGASAFAGCTGLSNVAIPASVSSISDSLFNNCTGLTSVTIPAGVTSIGASAFYVCTSLTSITIPAGVTSIGQGAFGECTSLTSITIPAGVTSIGQIAFADCTGLTSIMVLATTPPTLGATIFKTTTDGTSSNIPPCNITVPAGCGEAYKIAEGWSEYADYIVEAS